MKKKSKIIKKKPVAAKGNDAKAAAMQKLAAFQQMMAEQSPQTGPAPGMNYRGNPMGGM
jgi:hypothetical protein